MKTKLTKIEKIVLVVCVCLVPLTMGIGYMKQSKPKEKYVSIIKENKIAKGNEVALKNKEFHMKRNGKLDTSIENYFYCSVKQAEQIYIEFDKVDPTKVGTYKLSGKYKDKKFKFSIVVDESDNPMIQAEKSSFKYIIGQYSNVEEIKQIIGATAIDKNGNDLTNDIIGFPAQFPSEKGEHTYYLNVSDNQGNTGFLQIDIDFR